MQLSPERYRKVCIAALWSLCGIIVTGAAVRLTGSGLGCSDWPTCEPGHFTPHSASELKPMVEFGNRLVTGAVSIAVIAAVAGSFLIRPRRRDLTWWSVALVAGVFAQAIIGAFVTKSELQYSVVALHFLASMVLVWAGLVLVDRAGRIPGAPRRPIPLWARWIAAAATVVLLTGSVVTSSGPHAGDENVERLPIDLVWTVRTHSTAVWVLCLSVAAIAWRLRRNRSPILRRRVADLLAAIVLQGGIGYLQYFTGVPAILVGAHVAGAILVWVLAIRLALGTADASLPLEPSQRAADEVPAEPLAVAP
jgi:cytochrome c oxidase assembly protein subunit 15